MEQLRDLMPDPDRRDAGLERLMLRVHGGIRYANRRRFDPHRIPDATPDLPLSAQQIRIVACISHGMTDRMIAESFGVVEETIKRQVKISLRKMACKSRSQLACEAIRQGIIE